MDDQQSTPGLDRRDLIKRGAVVGGALVWSAPLVQTVASPALAATSPGPGPCPGARFAKTEGGKYLERSLGNGGCAPDGFDALPGTAFSGALPAGVIATFDDKTATIIVPAGVTVSSAAVKVGKGKQDPCPTVTPTVTNGPGGTTIYTYTVTTKNDISNVSFIVCP